MAPDTTTGGFCTGPINCTLVSSHASDSTSHRNDTTQTDSTGIPHRTGFASCVRMSSSLSVCAIGFYSALHGTISGNLFWKPWRDQGTTFQLKALEREQPLYCHRLVRMHAIKQSATLFINIVMTSFSLYQTHLCISHGACVQCYIGP